MNTRGGAYVYHCRLERGLERDDTILVERSQRGDQAAFRQLVERYQRKVYSLAYGMVHNPEDSLELAQEVFIKVHRYLGNFQGSSSFYTWLYRITMNVCIDFLRKERKGQAAVDYDDQRGHHEEVNQGEFPLVSSVATETPERVQSRRELGERIEAAMATLSEKHREVIVLREIEGLSYSDIAEALGIKKGTVMSRLHHARQNLQEELRPYLQGTETAGGGDEAQAGG